MNVHMLHITALVRTDSSVSKHPDNLASLGGREQQVQKGGHWSAGIWSWMVKERVCWTAEQRKRGGERKLCASPNGLRMWNVNSGPRSYFGPAWHRIFPPLLNSTVVTKPRLLVVVLVSDEVTKCFVQMISYSKKWERFVVHIGCPFQDTKSPWPSFTLFIRLY